MDCFCLFKVLDDEQTGRDTSRRALLRLCGGQVGSGPTRQGLHVLVSQPGRQPKVDGARHWSNQTRVGLLRRVERRQGRRVHAGVRCQQFTSNLEMEETSLKKEYVFFSFFFSFYYLFSDSLSLCVSFFRKFLCQQPAIRKFSESNSKFDLLIFLKF